MIYNFTLVKYIRIVSTPGWKVWDKTNYSNHVIGN